MFGGSPRLPERTQGLDERLVGQLRADEIDRAAEEDLEPCVTRAFREFGRERGLPDPRFPGDKDGRTRPRLRCVERAPELPELADASNEHVARRASRGRSRCLGLEGTAPGGQR